MIDIPLNNVPNQTFTVIVETFLCNISINSRDTVLGYSDNPSDLPSDLYFSMETNEASIANNSICENLNPIIKQAYLPFSGNFIFVDLQGSSDPFYEGLNTRFKLLYLSEAEHAELF